MNQVSIVAQPENFKIQLFKHQLAAIYKMEEREKSNKINDKMKFVDSDILFLIETIFLIRSWDLIPENHF